MELPDVIWLQKPHNTSTSDDVTWSEHPVYSDDPEHYDDGVDVAYRRVEADAKTVFGVLRKLHKQLTEREARAYREAFDLRRKMDRILEAISECEEPLPPALGDVVGKMLAGEDV